MHGMGILNRPKGREQTLPGLYLNNRRKPRHAAVSIEFFIIIYKLNIGVALLYYVQTGRIVSYESAITTLFFTALNAGVANAGAVTNFSFPHII